jgi:hypothetical protein
VLRGDGLDNSYTGGSDTLDLSVSGTGALIDLVDSEGEVYSRDGSTFLLYRGPVGL